MSPVDQSEVLFSLEPTNEFATELVQYAPNQNLVFERGGKQVLDLGLVRSKAADDDAHCIATLGREGDILVPLKWELVSRVQCAFLVADEYKSVTFVDMSTYATSQAYGGKDGTFKLLHPGQRRADSTCNICKIEIGIDNEKAIKFDIVWHFPTQRPTSRLWKWCEAVIPVRRSLVQTQQPVTPAPAAEIPTRERDIDVTRFVRKGPPLGEGTFGTVFKAIDRETGKAVAVKVQKPSSWSQLGLLKREIGILKSLSHPNIVEFLGSDISGTGMPEVKIFMSMKNGSVEELFRTPTKERPAPIPDDDLAQVVYHDALKGLDYLHNQGVIHRDIKPENILYAYGPETSFCFYLADFGLSNNNQSLARTICGTPRYIAPEMHNGGKQTGALDMWSLFVTVAWMFDMNGIRDADFDHYVYKQFLHWLLSAVQKNWRRMYIVQDLAVEDYTRRATAAEMLLKHFDGDGLTTPLERVTELPLVSTPTFAHPEKRVSRLPLGRQNNLPNNNRFGRRDAGREFLPRNSLAMQHVLRPNHCRNLVIRKEPGPNPLFKDSSVEKDVPVHPARRGQREGKEARPGPGPNDLGRVAGQARVTKTAAIPKGERNGAAPRHVPITSKTGFWVEAVMRQLPGAFPDL